MDVRCCVPSSSILGSKLSLNNSRTSAVTYNPRHAQNVMTRTPAFPLFKHPPGQLPGFDAAVLKTCLLVLEQAIVSCL